LPIQQLKQRSRVDVKFTNSRTRTTLIRRLLEKQIKSLDALGSRLGSHRNPHESPRPSALINIAGDLVKVAVVIADRVPFALDHRPVEIPNQRRSNRIGAIQTATVTSRFNEIAAIIKHGPFQYIDG
jgi:hypothetical protein